MPAGPGIPKILSIVGAGRSGTTVLAGTLGEIEGFASAGELRWLWERGVREERPCGCGLPASRCPVWAPVVASTLAAIGNAEPPQGLEQLIAAQHELARRYHYWRVLRSLENGDTGWAARRLVRTAMASAWSTFAEVTGSRVLVDTSKRPVDAAVLAGLQGIDHYVVHLVRDPRAVVNSWRRAKTFTTAGRSHTMGTRSLVPSLRRWTSSALMTEALHRPFPASRWLHMRYEDFAADPRPAVERIVGFVEETGTAPFVDPHTVLLRPNHMVAGNPSRFTVGPVTIRADQAWQHQLQPWEQHVVALVTWPLMRRYGYPHRLPEVA